jgi:hypothetical protein
MARRLKRLLPSADAALEQELVALQSDARENADGWRLEAIQDLIGSLDIGRAGAGGEKQRNTSCDSAQLRDTLAKAMRLRDDAVEYRFWRKSYRSSFIRVQVIIISGLLLAVALLKIAFPTTPPADAQGIALLIYLFSALFGALGASISTLIGLTRREYVPDQFESKTTQVAWPLIGAVAGVFAVLVDATRLLSIGGAAPDGGNFSTYLLAFGFGFSESFFRSTVGQISGESLRKDTRP